MRPRDRIRAQELGTALQVYETQRRKLPGIKDPARRAAFLEQLVESIRRIEYILLIRKRRLSIVRADPMSDRFDPLKAALLHKQRENIDEAFWLVFLSVHFGRHRYDGWRLCRDVYAGSPHSRPWTWNQVTANLQDFRTWLEAQVVAWDTDGITRRFGNHHKYQSLDAWSKNGTGAAIESYIDWVKCHKTHEQLVADARQEVGNDPQMVFDYLYRSMRAVVSFGRTARFDYLTMVGKLGLATIAPGSAYLQGATGPLKGARLLFANDADAKLRSSEMDKWLIQLGADLGVGMQVLEDALCNWQKSPGRFIPFRG